MTPEERTKTYLKQFEVQRLKMACAYTKLLSYQSKLTTNKRLTDVMTLEEQEEVKEIMKKTKRLVNRMNNFVNKWW